MSGTNRVFRSSLWLSLILLVACGGGGQSETGEAASPDPLVAARSIGRAASNKLMLALKKELTSAVASDGHAHALDVCSVEGQAMAASVSAELGVEVRRISLRPRNPEDAPRSYEKEALTRLSADSAPEDLVVELGTEHDGDLLFLSPIKLNSTVCLGCHGAPDELAPGVAEELARLYPEDQATGFALGDLRGAFAVRIPAERLAGAAE